MWVEELKEYVCNGTLTSIQLKILLERLSGMSYEAIRTINNFSCDNVIVTCLIRTSQCKLWYPGHPGGADRYLSPADMEKFLVIIKDAEDDANCIHVDSALIIAYELKVIRIKKAVKILEDIKSQKLIHHLDDVNEISRSWIYSIAKEFNIKLVTPQDLEYYRRVYCDSNAIHNFFSSFDTLLFVKDPRLLFNMDETMLSSNKKLKVIVGNDKKHPLVVRPKSITHLTGVITINANGDYFKPLIILPKKKNWSIENFFNQGTYMFH